MFARITRYKMKAGSREAATEVLHTLKEEVMALPGMHSFLNVMNDDGNGYVIALVENEASSEANAGRIAALWGNFAPYLESPPEVGGYEVIAHWSN